MIFLVEGCNDGITQYLMEKLINAKKITISVRTNVKDISHGKQQRHRLRTMNLTITDIQKCEGKLTKKFRDLTPTVTSSIKIIHKYN